MESMKAIQARVTGQVQGVAFRWYAQQRAQQLGVVVALRVHQDAAVDLVAHPPDDAVDALVEWCRHGPPSARVRDLAARDAAVSGASSFEVTG